MKANINELLKKFRELNIEISTLIELSNSPYTERSFIEVQSLKVKLLDGISDLENIFKKVKVDADLIEQNLNVVKDNVHKAIKIGNEYIDNFDFTNIKK